MGEEAREREGHPGVGRMLADTVPAASSTYGQGEITGNPLFQGQGG